VRIDAGTPDGATELAAALNAADCVAIADAASVAVIDLGLAPEEEPAARIGLVFFLKVWAAERPDRPPALLSPCVSPRRREAGRFRGRTGSHPCGPRR